MADELEKEKPAEHHALEPVSQEQRSRILTALVRGLTQGIAAQVGRTEMQEPRILRLLQKLDPALYTALKIELKAVLTLLASPTTSEPMKERLTRQLKDTIEQRLGPAFSKVAIAEGMLSNGQESYYLDSARAAVGDIPHTLGEAPDQNVSAIHALQIMTAIKSLRTLATTSEDKLEKLLEDYVIERLRAAGCRVEVERRTLSIPLEDFPMFKRTLDALCDELGIDVMVWTVGVMGAYHPRESYYSKEFGRIVFTEKGFKLAHSFACW